MEPVASTKVSAVEKTAATFEGDVNPEGEATTYRFEYVDDAQFAGEGGFAGPHVRVSPPVLLAGDFEVHPVSYTLPAGSLVPGTTYHVRLLAENGAGSVVGEEVTFQALPSAGVESTSVLEVTSVSAALEAQINPLGDATTYQFEYLSEAAFLANGESFTGPEPAVALPSPEASIGAGDGGCGSRAAAAGGPSAWDGVPLPGACS